MDGIARIGGLAALGVAALTASANALTSGSILVAVVAVVLFAAFVAFTRSSVRRTRAIRVREAPGAAVATLTVPYVPVTGPRPEPAPEPSPGPSPAEPVALVAAEVSEPAAAPDGELPPSAPDRQPVCAPDIRVPATLHPDVVAMALLESAAAAGDVVAVHLWLEDPGSGTLRHLSGVGTMVPEPHPRPLDDDPLGIAATSGVARMSAVAAVRVSGETSTLWRFALPIQADETRGVAGIDFSSAEAPDGHRLVELTALLRPSLAGALALHVTRTQAATARALVATARELTRRIDPDEVIAQTLEHAMSLSDAATGSVMLLDDESGLMRIAAAQGLAEDIVRDTRVREGEGIAGWVLATRKPVLVEDLPGRKGRVRRGEVRSAVSVPIADEDGILGVLNVGSREYPARFTDAHMDALQLLGTQTAVALRNARAMVSARELYFATLRALVLALETKDPYARGGTERVVRYATRLGEELGLDELEHQALEVASLLHDIGMSATGETVAASSRPLSTFERGLLKLHPVLAAEILEEVPALRSVIPIVYHHHEWFDGHGYVVGLSGESIPLASRILAVADAFVAMTSARPYREAMGMADALAEIETKAGTQFDPEVVGAFLEMMRRQPELAPDMPRE